MKFPVGQEILYLFIFFFSQMQNVEIFMWILDSDNLHISGLELILVCLILHDCALEAVNQRDETA